MLHNVLFSAHTDIDRFKIIPKAEQHHVFIFSGGLYGMS